MGTLRRRHDEFVDVLLPRLEEVVTLLGDGALRQGTDNDLISLREANARLRTLARQLSRRRPAASSKVEAAPDANAQTFKRALPLVWFACESRRERLHALNIHSSNHDLGRLAQGDQHLPASLPA